MEEEKIAVVDAANSRCHYMKLCHEGNHIAGICSSLT
jgi:hypothetical protein